MGKTVLLDTEVSCWVKDHLRQCGLDLTQSYYVLLEIGSPDSVSPHGFDHLGCEEGGFVSYKDSGSAQKLYSRMKDNVRDLKRYLSQPEITMPMTEAIQCRRSLTYGWVTKAMYSLDGLWVPGPVRLCITGTSKDIPRVANFLLLRFHLFYTIAAARVCVPD